MICISSTAEISGFSHTFCEDLHISNCFHGSNRENFPLSFFIHSEINLRRTAINQMLYVALSLFSEADGKHLSEFANQEKCRDLSLSIPHQTS